MLSFCIFSPPSSPPSPLLSSAGLSPPMSLPAGLPPQVEMEALGENFSDEFQVDDLLDLRGLPEPEKEVVEEEEERGGASIDTDEKETSLLLSEISLPEETEAADLEWLSRFVDDCHSEYPQPLWLAPVLTARAKNLSSGVQLPPEGCRMNMAAFIPVKAKRSKRPRSTYAPWSLSSPLRLGDASPVSSIASSPSPSSSSSTLTSVLAGGNPASNKSQSPKKRGRKPKSHLSAAGGEGRCRHCGVQKTPQWRAGPLGPKTLCNACGVRYKSGRLLPEYRPAGSPTFVSKVHSNSHRKVLEMRRKKEQLFTASALPVPSC